MLYFFFLFLLSNFIANNSWIHKKLAGEWCDRKMTSAKRNPSNLQDLPGAHISGSGNMTMTTMMLMLMLIPMPMSMPRLLLTTMYVNVKALTLCMQQHSSTSKTQRQQTQTNTHKNTQPSLISNTPSPHSIFFSIIIK